MAAVSLFIASSASPYLGESYLNRDDDLLFIFKIASAIFDLLLQPDEEERHCYSHDVQGRMRMKISGTLFKIRPCDYAFISCTRAQQFALYGNL